MDRNNRCTNNEYLKRPRHARVSFHSATCQDCGRGLQVTHLVRRFGGRCRPCWSALHTGGHVVTEVVY